MTSDVTQRFTEAFTYLQKIGKVSSANDFAKQIGISTSMMTEISKGRSNAGITPVQNIVKSFGISAQWLLTGFGNMIVSEDHTPIFSEQPRGVPFYDVDFCGGFDMMLNDQTAVPTGYIDFPQYNKADSWARITGHSMEPLISNGDIIALRRVEDWQSYILYGEIYGIMTDEYRTVKRVRKTQDPNKILLEPINKDFDPTELEKKLITGVWAVLGCAKKFF